MTLGVKRRRRRRVRKRTETTAMLSLWSGLGCPGSDGYDSRVGLLGIPAVWDFSFVLRVPLKNVDPWRVHIACPRISVYPIIIPERSPTLQ